MDKHIEFPSTDSLLMDIKNLLETSRPRMDSDVWDTGDIAHFLRLTKHSVQSHIVNSNGFPQYITLPSGGRRWIAKEVKAWALRRR